jgi:hypothetical protein
MPQFPESRARSDLAEAVARDVRPYVLDLGFELDRRPKEERSWRWRSGAFYRRRDGYVDELNIQWEKYGGAYFIFNFWTDQAERMDVALRYMSRIAEGPMARIYPASYYLRSVRVKLGTDVKSLSSIPSPSHAIA